jgi:protein O-mannosyl-transferase
MKNKYAYLIVIFLIIASCADFGRIVENGFIDIDDGAYITENLNIKSGFNYESIKWAFTSSSFYYWQPLTWLSHMLDWSLFGDNASGHHLVSLLLHIGAVIFLFLFLNKTTGNLWSAAFATAFFALHPLRVESVAWAAERKDVLSMFFGMACFYAYAFYAESSKLSRYLLCLILFALALMSKPMMITLPFVLMLLDYWPLKRWQKAFNEQGKSFNSIGGLIREKVPFICLSIAAGFLTFWGQTKYGSVASSDFAPFLTRVYNAIFSYVAYLGKIFWPAQMAVFYPYDLSLPLWKVLISGIILIVITLAVLYYIKKLPFLFVGWFTYLGTLVPLIGFVQVGMQAMADRHSYLPSIGIAIILAWGIPFLIKREDTRKKILFPAAIAVLFILTVLTWQQCGHWKNSITLFSHALQTTKDNDRMHNNLGFYFLKQGQSMKAIYHFNKAIDISPGYGSYNNRGLAYAGLDMYEQAIDDYNKSISLNPEYAEAYYNRGTLYGKKGEYQLAIDDFNKVISLKPDHIKAYSNRGIVYTKLGLHQKAINDFNKAIHLKPDYADAYNNRAFVHLSLGNLESGCYDAKKACELGNCATLKAARGKGLCR